MSNKFTLRGVRGDSCQKVDDFPFLRLKTNVFPKKSAPALPFSVFTWVENADLAAKAFKFANHPHLCVFLKNRCQDRCQVINNFHCFHVNDAKTCLVFCRKKRTPLSKINPYFTVM